MFSKASMSCLAAAPDVVPVSMIPVQQFVIFHALFAAILFCRQGDAVVVIAAIPSI